MSADAEPLWSASGWAGSEPPLNGSAAAAAAEAEAGRARGPAERGGTAAELAATVAVQCVYALLCLLGLPGNALVIFVVLRYAKMRTATNIYLLNLAVADELFMLGAPFAAASAALRRWPFGLALCRAVLAVDGLNAFASAFCLSALSLDRYIAVAHPLRAATYRRPRVAKRAAGAAWLLALLAASPIPAFAGTAAARDGDAAACGLLWPGPAWAAAFAAYSGLLGFVLPALAMALCYALIAAELRGAARPPGWRQRRRSEGRLTRLALAAAAAFVLCWAPFYALRLLELLPPGRPAAAAAAAADASLLLGYANSCANPILYAFLSENFRRSFHGVLRRCLRDAGPCCCRAGDGRDGEDEEEPLDYRAVPRGDRKGCSWPPLPCQHDPPRPQPCCAPGAPRTKTTPF